MSFSPEYVRTVLNENFEDAKATLLEPLLAVHFAHLVMLVDQRIITVEAARTLRHALRGIDLDSVRRQRYDGSCEDLFFHVDRLLIDACGDDVAGRLHTARSRNDIDMTMYRMCLRESVLTILEAVNRLRESLLAQARRHGTTIFAAHTHSQPAQPTTVAHYLLGVIEQLERDVTRLFAAYETTNRNPLGACAITGTGFPIDRDRTSVLLGFAGPTGNTYGSIATVDYLVECAAATANLVLGLGRFVQDMLLWCTVEVGYLRLPDGFVQTSSIMPQKRNPVALEHARALSSKAFAELTAISLTVHNTPFGDIVDTEDDLQPLIGTAFRDAARAVSLLAAAMAEAEFNVERMRLRAGENWVTVTELADTLVREHGVSFMTAHAMARAVIRSSGEDTQRPLSEVLARAAEAAGHVIRLDEAAIARLLSPEHFIAVRQTHGGPAPAITAEAIEQSWTRLGRDRGLLDRTRASLVSARDVLRAAVEAIGATAE